MAKRILLIVASKYYQPFEYSHPKKILEEAGFEIVTASNEAGMAIAANGVSAKVDVALSKVNVAGYDGIFIIGGPGAPEYLDNEKTYHLIQEVAESNKLFGAICISPRILAHAGVLRGRKATGWNGDGELAGVLSSAGAEYVHEPVVVDKNLVTADGPMSAEGWGKEIVRLLKGK